MEVFGSTLQTPDANYIIESMLGKGEVNEVHSRGWILHNEP